MTDEPSFGIKPPPHSSEAEASVIGGLLLDNGRMADVADMVRAPDFYRRDHRLIFTAMLTLDAAGRAFDVVTLAELLQRDKMLDEAGGFGYLGQLARETPSAANVRAYAQIVRDRAVRRRMKQSGASLIALADTADTASDLIAQAQAEVLDAAGDAPGTDPEHAGEGLPEWIDSLDARSHRGDGLIGLPTGLADLDNQTGGLAAGDLWIVAGRPSMGKAQPLDAQVLLADGGFVPMGSLIVGTQLASTDGGASEVVGVFPQGEKEIYRITLSDGRSAEACAEHLWRVRYRQWDKPRILDTQKIASMLTHIRYRGRLWIDPPNGNFGGDKKLPLDPWVLGALIGDGTLTMGTPGFTSADQEVIDEMSRRIAPDMELGSPYKRINFRIRTLGGPRRKGICGLLPNRITTTLKILGLAGCRSEHKFIPSCYLEASRPSRLALLRGLLDTDGTVEKFGAVSYSTSSPQLARDVVALARSLGARATTHSRYTHYSYKGEKRKGLLSYKIGIQGLAGQEIFTLERKASRIKSSRTARLNIVSVQPTRRAQAQCIAVSHPSRLYITNDYVVTHNTALAMSITEQVSVNQAKPALVFSMEMSRSQLLDRMVSNLASIDHDAIRKGKLSEHDYPRITAGADKVQRSKLYIDATPSQTVVDLRAKARRVKHRHGLSLVVVDYLQLMTGHSRRDNREGEIAEISRGLKALAKELDVPVIALSQLNRAVESRDDRRPRMSDLRESGAIEQDADVIVLLYRQAAYDRDFLLPTVSELNIGKQRNGPTGVVYAHFYGTYMRFLDADMDSIRRYQSLLHAPKSQRRARHPDDDDAPSGRDRAAGADR